MANPKVSIGLAIAHLQLIAFLVAVMWSVAEA
jgi:hypothetical protein